MPIVKCECKECKFYDDRLCCKDVVELKMQGQCVEGIKIELNKALEEQRMAIAKLMEQRVSVVPYPYYNTYLGGGGGEDI